MRNVTEYAKFFLKRDLDSSFNTFDGNMKLQKLLFFANVISCSQNDHLLFQEDMLAFENGTVIEEVRQRYKNDYFGFKEDAKEFNPNFSQEEYDVLNATIDIFGKLSARELSELNHQFNFWNERLEKSKNILGYHVKERSIITEDDIKKEIDKIKVVLDSYKLNKGSNDSCEMINGVAFYYNPEEVCIDIITPKLEDFSNEADEEAYSVFIDDGDLVIM